MQKRKSPSSPVKKINTGNSSPTKKSFSSHSPTTISPSKKEIKNNSETGEKKNVLLAEQPKNQRWINWWTRTLYTILMVLGFFVIIFSGHASIVALVFVIQILIFKETIAIAHVPTKEKKLPWFRVINWYFLFSGCYYLYGESLITYFKPQFMETEFLKFLVMHHRFISFSLYCLGFIMFVMNLKKGHYKFQFMQFAWTHMILLVVVFQSHFMIDNIFEGIIWFFLPVSLIITNDIFAYIFGFFWGRTPLIQLSPKKTWEGFIGAFFATVLMGISMSYILSQFDYFICPATNISTSILNSETCEKSSTFIPMHFNFPTILTSVLRVFGIRWSTISILPAQFHAVVLSIFASIIAPFGGFFASGLKRAFKIKDFGDSIPGHGGVTDRCDCQLLMALFSYVYFQTFIKSPELGVTTLINQFITLEASEQLEVYNEIKKLLINKALI